MAALTGQGIRALPGSRRLVAALPMAIGFAALAWGVASIPRILSVDPGWDAVTYLGAGERLNAGHQLYHLVAGDRFMGQAQTFGPLLSPPPIAVLWRPLALLGPQSVMAWWAACATTLVLAAAALVVRAPVVGSVWVAALALPIQQELVAGNVNGLLIGGLTAAWLLQRSGHDRASGALVALMAAVKLWPGILILWFVAQRRWRAVGAFAAAGAALAAVSVAGAGLPAHLEYLGIARSIAASPLSLAGSTGIPWIGWALTAGVAVAVLAARRSREATWAAAVVAIVLGSPAVYMSHYAMLLCAAVPFAWPMPAEAGARPLPPLMARLRLVLEIEAAAAASLWLALQVLPLGMPGTLGLAMAAAMTAVYAGTRAPALGIGTARPETVTRS